MIVVSDTSPISALMTVGEAHILARLFGEVIIPKTVCEELLRNHPYLPEWLRVETVKNTAEKRSALPNWWIWSKRKPLNLRKNSAPIAFSWTNAKAAAVREGLAVIGLLGVVLLAKRRRLVPSARTFLQRLEQEAGMYLSENLRNEALKTVGE